MKTFIILSLIVVLFSGSGPIPVALAQYQSGGVNYQGTWYVGEGLKPGDYFEYRMCHVDYEECAEFDMQLWIEGTIKVGTEDKWLAQAVVYDGNKIVKGNMELGKIAPEPSGGSPELSVYRSAFKTSIVWLSAYATKNIGSDPKGEKSFTAPSWGKIANIGGEQIIPTALETITVPDGTYDTVRIEWKTGGQQSKVWVVDNFPFPIKANTWTHVSSGRAPQEYRFELLDYKEYVSSNPFTNVKPTTQEQVVAGCPQFYDKVPIKRSTNDGKYLIDLKYGPSDPAKGCQIEWLIEFKNKFHETEFLNLVQYDIFVVDEKLTLPPLRSIAKEEGRSFLFSESGQVLKSIIVKENPGTAHYVIWVYGLAPQNVIPDTSPDFLKIDIPIGGKTTSPPAASLNIPSWIKNNAGWWANGQINDSDFVLGIQYLINNKIMVIPSTTSGSSTGSNEIPAWIKNNAGWWASGQISDNDFVQGIQYLIKNGIMKIV
ncbi:MAG TPA: peptidase [Nitrosopumilaceae archaeon]|nr:peptidase [Nitrosopumilaceae archaeon]